jgi:3-deoxy-7-phosphoheptulonate synthase
MSPEGSPIHSTVLNEAIAIRDVLVDAQTEVVEAARAREREIADEIRQKLGLPPPKAVMVDDIINTRILDKSIGISPSVLEVALPLTRESAETTRLGRTAVSNIFRGEDLRLIYATGPCSIHDLDAAIEYAKHVAEMRGEFGDYLEILMRFYTEKPRSGLDWKGLVYDPMLDGSNDVNLGLVLTRMGLLEITGMGVPAMVERLNPNTPQHINGLVALDTIGARNVADQTARELLSGSSSFGSIKNGTDGDVNAAVQGLISAGGEHAFLGTSHDGFLMLVSTAGNPEGFVILRGGNGRPNYQPSKVAGAVRLMEKKHLPPAIFVDLSHANSSKIADNQVDVARSVAGQIKKGQSAIKGTMAEGNIVAGRQDLEEPRDLEYGKSITDECVDTDTDWKIAKIMANAAKTRLRNGV